METLNTYTHISKNGYKYAFKSPNYYCALLYAMYKFTEVHILILDND